jgi:hypothetical protein
MIKFSECQVEKGKVQHAFQRRLNSNSAVPWWLKLVHERPFAVAGTVVSVIGGLILLMFFFQLGGMPELDLAGASAVLMAVALVGFALATSLTLSGFCAGLPLRGQNSGLEGSSLRTRVLFLIAPGIFSFGLMALYFLFDPSSQLPSWTAFVPLVLMLLLAFLYSVGSEFFYGKEGWRTFYFYKKVLRKVCLFSFDGLPWVFVTYSLFLTFFMLYPWDGDTSMFFAKLFLWSFFCYGLNLLVWRSAHVNIFLLLAFCIVFCLLVLLNTTGNWVGFPRAIVGALGLGEIPVKMIVTQDGCSYLNKFAGSRVVCRIEPGEKSAVVCPVLLRSRIGSPFFVGFSAYEPNGQWPRLHLSKPLDAIAILKTDVLSWARLSRVKPPEKEPTKSDAIVTYLDLMDKGAWLRDQCGEGLVGSSQSASTAVSVQSVSSDLKISK